MMSITKESKKKIISNFAINKNDTGSSEVQIAVLSERITNLIEHFKNHKHDNHSKRGLLAMVNKRKKLLSYLLQKDETKYQEIIKKLSIRG
jgi:small subunit ribosomal protein S15